MSDRVIVAGMMLMDVLVKSVDRSVFERDTNYPQSVRFLTGGDAMNVANNLQKMGAKVSAAALLGRDIAGRRVMEEIEANGIDHRLVEIREDVETSVSVVLCDALGERHFLCHMDSTNRFDASGVKDEDLKNADALYIGSMMALPGMEGGTLKGLFERAKRLGVLTAMDATQPPDDRWLERIEDALAYTDLFIPSYGEAVGITGEKDPVRAAAFLRQRGVGLSGVKLGEKGCYIDDGAAPFFLPPIRCAHPLDLTGAGDSFMSGFLYGRLHGWSALECARFATATSYSCIQCIGASTHLASCERIRGILEEHRSELQPVSTLAELG